MTTVVELPDWPLPARLRASLAGAGIEGGAMATYLGIGRNTISRYLTGKTQPRDAVLRLWALQTGVSFEWLRNGATGSVETGPVVDLLPRLDSNQQPFDLP